MPLLNDTKRLCGGFNHFVSDPKERHHHAPSTRYAMLATNAATMPQDRIANRAMTRIASGTGSGPVRPRVRPRGIDTAAAMRAGITE